MTEQEQLEKAIATLEGQRAILGDAVVNAALAPMREKLAALQTQAQPREAQQRKQVTVLFADVSGFTAMSESMDAEEVSGLMNALWARLDGAIVAHGGRIDKHIGDAVMALFGAPVAREDDPERAIRAALAMQAEIKNWKTEMGEPSPGNLHPALNLQMRIGINTGPVLLGSVGTTGEYTAMGDTVNLASRLEHAAPVGGILISHDSYRHVRGIFDVLPLDPISVKGKAEPIQVYVVRAVKPRTFRVTTRGVEGIETRTIGREAELARLQTAIETMIAERRSHLASIVAEAGTGKSRLLYEFSKWLDVQPHRILLFKGRATQEMINIPYSLFRDVLASRFEIQDSDRASVAREKLERGLTAYAAGEPDEADMRAHFIGHLIGFDFSASPHLKGILGDARQIRDRAFHYAAEFFADVMRDQAAVILLEDIHWADDGSLDLIEHLIREQPEAPLFIVGLTRPTLFERRPQWGTGPAAHLRINLQPLSEQNCRQLVAEILRKVSEIPEALQELIVTRAEGSPFYVEELIKVLIDDSVIITGDETWRVEAERLAAVRVPATLTGLLQARLDTLPVPEREALQQASVVGRVFWSNIVERMRNPEAHVIEAAPVGDSLHSLNRKELVFRRDSSAFADTAEYIFKHAILHDVTYESVLKRLRRSYHLQVAEGLVDLSGERVGEYAGRIGEHYERAGEWLKAAEWYARAGKQAQETYAPDSAIGYFQKASNFLKESGGEAQRPLQIEVCERLGEVLNWQARYAEAIDIYLSMHKIAEEAGNAAAQSRALQGIAFSQSSQGDHRAALESAVRAEGAANTAGARLELARALRTQGFALYRLGDTQSVLTLGEQVLALMTELGDRGEVARSLNLLGAAHYGLGRYSQAENYWGQALAIFKELGNHHQEMDLLSNLGVIADALGDYETALERYQGALEIARDVGYRDGEIAYLSNRGGERAALGDYEAAEQDLRQVIELTQSTSSWILTNTYNYLAEACLGQNKTDEALSAARQALALGQAEGAQEYIATAWRALGRVTARLARPIEIEDKQTGQTPTFTAVDCFAESARICAEIGMEGERARTLREWARYELRHGDKAKGQAMWRESREIFERLGAVREAGRMENLP
jgi:class 3 adenylate cyclase/tetratricopeptide (TPR) repeat protein